MKSRVSFFAIIAVLVLASLACKQAGQILTPEEATAIAQQGNKSENQGSSSNGDQDNQFSVGQTVKFAGTGFLIPIMKEPGDRTIYSNAGRNQTATIKGSREVDGELWYQIESGAGNGWVIAKNLEAVDEEVTQPAPGEASETPSDETAPSGDVFAAGDTVYLAGRNYMINLMDGPGSKKIIAGQQRGVPVTILEAESVDGAIWYQIDSPTGEGWVPAENLTAEQP
jgi:hypothetical protein